MGSAVGSCAEVKDRTYKTSRGKRAINVEEAYRVFDRTSLEGRVHACSFGHFGGLTRRYKFVVLLRSIEVCV